MLLCLASIFKFEEAPPTPPTRSAASKLEVAAALAAAEEADPSTKQPFFTFPATAGRLLANPGFCTPLAGAC